MTLWEKIMNTSLYSNTPTVTVLDNRGLTVRDIAYHRHPSSPRVTDDRVTRHQFDARGFLTKSADPRLHDTGRVNFSYLTDLYGTNLRAQGADDGTTLALSDAAGRPFIEVSNIRTADDGTQDSGQAVTRTWQYEETSLPGRPLSITEQVTDEDARITERFVYAGNTDAEKVMNLAGQCVSHYDTAGLVQMDSVALTGEPLSVTRRLLKNADSPDVVADWQGADVSAWNDLLNGEVYTTLTTADATGSVLTTTDAKGNRQRVAYDVAGLLSGSWLTVKKDGVEKVIVESLTYSAAGQKLREVHGNGVVTTYTYEAETQRLTGIKTERPAEHISGAKVLQDLRYTYDPVGNVLKISNDAEEARFWRNQKVVPENTYTYDSLYQLVSATGREMANAGQQGSGLPPVTVPLSTDSSTYTNYTRTYTYDESGNLTQIRHSAPATNNSYTMDITVSNRSNRGVLSTLTENPSDVDALFTPGGQQMQLLPGLSLVWTPRSELLKVTPVVRNGSEDDRESYRYDSGSQRLLKVSVQKTNASMQTQQAMYLPGLELRSTKSGKTETESLQVITVGEAGRAQVRVLHWESGKPAETHNDQMRYSYDNLIGSSQLELDGTGNVISMEEYYPYGGTAVWTARSAVEANYKTVRYSGKERDATGLYYYGYRYYQPWVGRWLSADPAGTVDGLNLFRMVKNNPSSGFDVQGLMWKAVASGAAAAATMGYEVYKHSAPPKSVEQTSSSSFGNDRIHALNVKHTEKQNKFSLMEKISKNLSGRGGVLSDLSQGKLPAHESIKNQKENITALAEFSQTGNISQLDVKPIIKESISDAQNNIPTRIFQAVKGFRTVTTVDKEGIKELMDTKNIIIDEVKDTAAVGVSIGLAGNAVLTAAKVLMPVATIPIIVAQAAWAASSVGKIVNESNAVVKTHLEKSDITHKGRTEALNQIKDINIKNRNELISEVKKFIPRME
ncbi:RHS repeat protein [Aeromonas sp. HMWF014]|uniref:RHS repeat protein n=1 Tax=Aeromonas sp. HMWF014 TaxID=2056850 RepID=UPI001C627EEB|nr:RHS repeat domain-containing protein [Aeromonas sp. HMWF014]